MAISTARLLRTGRVPGRPRHTGQTLVLGGSPKRVEQPQKIFVRVRSWTWTSRPMTGAYLARTSGAREAATGVDFGIGNEDYSTSAVVNPPRKRAQRCCAPTDYAGNWLGRGSPVKRSQRRNETFGEGVASEKHRGIEGVAG